MADFRLDPAGLRPSETDGDVVKTVAGVATWGAAPTGLDNLVVSVTNGVPHVMFDADATVVTEG